MTQLERIIKWEKVYGEPVMNASGQVFYDMLLCENHRRINARMFEINFSMINESEAAAIRYIRNNINDN